MDINEPNIEPSFVRQDIQDWLAAHGWHKTYDSFHKTEVSDIRPRGLMGMQAWERNDDSSIELNIHFCDDDKHNATIWWGENDSEGIKLRNIRSTLTRKGLIDPA